MAMFPDKFLTALHLMVDVETTGLNPWRHRITSLGAVAFHAGPDWIAPILPGKNAFYRAISLLSPDLFSEFWDAKTEAWRKENKVDTMEMEFGDQPLLYTERALLEKFLAWVKLTKDNTNSTAVYFWAKPSHFDWNFYDQLVDRCDLRHVAEELLHRHRVVDCASITAGWGVDWKEAEAAVPMNGAKHNAYIDADWQVNVLDYCLETAKGQVGR